MVSWICSSPGTARQRFGDLRFPGRRPAPTSEGAERWRRSPHRRSSSPCPKDGCKASVIVDVAPLGVPDVGSLARTKVREGVIALLSDGAADDVAPLALDDRFGVSAMHPP